ncbi:sensor histidine kinase [Nocardioides hwasunensis]|uniref:Sensor histidine kinase n=1 Tax=Nocardioides hwasunensis TaxID=397258 RepID=A0ABR8MKP9_9ACTN|nr:sensor histidine kinase [Nocardioides hwasunensis]MBD3916602.1 sensor histidine kinase [Nocardioides hwasunensis]
MTAPTALAAQSSDSGPWARWGWAMAAIWLGFLAFPVISVWQSDTGWAGKAVTLAAIAAFAVLYVVGFSIWERHAMRVFVALVLLMATTVPVLGIDAVGMTPYLGAYSALQVPAPAWRWTTPLTALVPLFSLLGDEFPAFFFVLVWPIIGGCVIVRVLTEAEMRAGETRGSLAIVAERERVARDVHDVLGHSLTALSIKAELAARLIDVDPQRARAELESIQATARSALAEVRATVGGLRAANLEAELAAAPRVLADAGVRTKVAGEIADTDPRHRTLMAWVLRESVTNVVRHAQARSVVIELGPHGIAVSDDGAGCDGTEGNGLRGMRERVSGAGGTLTISPAEPGTRVEVGLP